MPNHNHKQITTKPKLPKNHNKHNLQHQLKNQESRIIIHNHNSPSLRKPENTNTHEPENHHDQ